MPQQIRYQTLSSFPIIEDGRATQYIEINVEGDGSCLYTAGLGKLFFKALNNRYQMPQERYDYMLKWSYHLKNKAQYNRLVRAAEAPADPVNNPNKIKQIKKVYQFINDYYQSPIPQSQFMKFVYKLVQEPEGWSALLECLTPAARYIALDNIVTQLSNPSKMDINDIVSLESEGFVEVTYDTHGNVKKAFPTLQFLDLYKDTRYAGPCELRSFGQVFNVGVAIYDIKNKRPNNSLLPLPYLPLYGERIADQSIVLLKSGDHYRLGIKKEEHNNAKISFNAPTKPVSDYQSISPDKSVVNNTHRNAPIHPTQQLKEEIIVHNKNRINGHTKRSIITLTQNERSELESFIVKMRSDLDKNRDHIINQLANLYLNKVFASALSESQKSDEVEYTFKMAEVLYSEFKEAEANRDIDKLHELHKIFIEYQQLADNITFEDETNQKTNENKINQGASELRKLYKTLIEYQQLTHSGTFFAKCAKQPVKDCHAEAIDDQSQTVNSASSQLVF